MNNPPPSPTCTLWLFKEFRAAFKDLQDLLVQGKGIPAKHAHTKCVVGVESDYVTEQG